MPTQPPSRLPRAALVLLAAGSGSRVGHETNKVFLPLAGLRVLTWSLRWASHVPAFERFLLVIAERDREMATEVLAREAHDLDVELVIGGSTRHASEWAALQALEAPIVAGDLDVVVIHDAARPLAPTPMFADVTTVAAAAGGALPVRPQPDLVPLDANAVATETVDAVAVQTPQAFAAGVLLDSYRRAESDGFVGTDTASCVETYAPDTSIRCTDGDARNIKITFPEDLFLAEHLLSQARWDLSGPGSH